MRLLLLHLVLLIFLLGCSAQETTVSEEAWAPDADSEGHTAASEFTAAANRAVAASLPLDDPRDFQNAERGLLVRESEVVIESMAGGSPVWDTREYAFLQGDAPDTVNPSLWRQARLNSLHGLYEVVPDIYQVRGYDLSNMTLIKGETGWILIDPLTARETAAAALAVAQRELGERKIRAIVFTHSHVDHFGGVRGVLSAEELASGDVRIIAPAGFMDEATSENVMAGVAMSRRSAYMYGRDLERNPRGHVGSGLGKSPAFGSVGLAQPTEWVDHTPQVMTLDGVRFVFQYAPESEAPAELTFYLPDYRAFCGAEIVSHTMHNLYTLRGAKVRDALKWSGYIDEAIDLFGETEVMFASHHWPTWGNGEIIDYLEKQRDTYKYIHDQSMRLANRGATPREIAEMLELPESLRTSFANRGYYGTLRHNAKAVYQSYFGWYDGNPANLNPLPPEEAGTRYVAAMGGGDAVYAQARRAFELGDYRWSATLLDHLIFAEPDRAPAHELLARSYDQLGYQAESAPWRDEYLVAARELRHGLPEGAFSLASAVELLANTPMERFLEAMAASVNGPEADGGEMTLNFVFTDIDESYVLTLQNAVLHHKRRDPDPNAEVTVRITKALLLRLFIGQAGLRDVIFGDELDVDGSRTELLAFFSLLEPANPVFPIVTP